MKTKKTLKLEQDIYNATKKVGVFGCFEVTIGFFGKERVDYMTYDTKGIFRCYEIKVSKSDFHSNAKLSFVGHYNYYVLTRNVGENLVKSPKKQDIDEKVYKYRRTINGRSSELTIPYTDMLKESLLRSLYREANKWYIYNYQL